MSTLRVMEYRQMLVTMISVRYVDMIVMYSWLVVTEEEVLEILDNQDYENENILFITKEKYNKIFGGNISC